MVLEAKFTDSKESPKEDSVSVAKWQVFVTHAHADRGLAGNISRLLEHAFSGLVVPFFSSDPSPAGGLQPGDEWYARIHKELLSSHSVWVLATPTAIVRPWVYWEAGIGRAVCRRGIVVVRVGLKPEDLPSPLNAYESYDGTKSLDNGVVDLLTKIGDQIGMKIHAEWIASCAEEFATAAAGHESVETNEDTDPKVSPEAVSRIEGLIARLESVTSQAEGRESPRADAEARFEHTMDIVQSLTGTRSMIYPHAQDLMDVVARFPNTIFRVDDVDNDGDLRIYVSPVGGSEDGPRAIYLKAKHFKTLDDVTTDDPRVSAVVSAMREAVQAARND